jgi:thiamine-monophosphate kinase
VTSEDKLIQRIARTVPSEVGRGQRDVRLGIGDDAAILKSKRGVEWVVSCDSFIEGVHFWRDAHPADSVGYKALVRATSDLVAMGAEPRIFMMALALPAAETTAWLDGFLHGMARAARLLDMHLIGGDTTASETINAVLTVYGQVQAGQGLTRSGARPGDRIYVSGILGRADMGLELLRAAKKSRGWAGPPSTGTITQMATVMPRGKWLNELLGAHLYPLIGVQLGMWLGQKRIPSAMIDLSDGLSTDLQRLCEASGVGAKLWEERIPRVSLPPRAAEIAPLRGIDPLRMALHGGDDYELLFTVPQKSEGKLLKAATSSRYAWLSGVTYIGEVIPQPRTRHGSSRMLAVDGDGRTKPLEPAGWDPFRRAE